jgi:hypothetical protein
MVGEEIINGWGWVGEGVSAAGDGLGKLQAERKQPAAKRQIHGIENRLDDIIYSHPSLS